ncbi:MAG: sensor histidine [Desulfovibrionaceae bacterium]|nr:MAG: sensor histidine [Desulfovibrionaceae bacterium]
MTEKLSNHQNKEDSASPANKTLEAFIRLYRISGQSITQILDSALEETLSLTESDVGYIYFYDEATRLFTLYSWSNTAMASCAVVEKKTSYELEKTGLWGEAVRKREPIIVNNYLAPHPLKRGQPEGHVALKNFLTIPVFHNESIVAVIGVGNRKDDYTLAHVHQLELFSKGVWELVLRKQFEQQLAESSHIFRSLVDTTLDATLLESTDGTIHYANKAACDLFGMTSDELQSAGRKGLVDSKDTRAARLLQERDHFGKAKGELRFRRKDGSIFEGELSSAIISGISKGDRASVVIRDVSERKRYEQNLKKALVFNNTILEHATVGIAVYSAKTGRCALANKTLAEFLGGAVEDLLAQNFRELDTWKSTGRLEQAERVLDEKTTIKSDNKFTSSFGKVVYLESTFAAIETGGKSYLLRVEKDISETKRLEKEINDQLEFVNTLIDTIPSPLYLKDVSGHYILCNRAYESLRGSTKENLYSKTVYDILPRETADFHSNKEIEMYASGASISYETQTTTFSGEQRDIIFNKAPFMDTEGNVRGLIAIMTDISERKCAESEIAEREATLRKILEGINAGIIIVDPKTFSILDVNEAAEKILGESKAAIVGRPCRSFKWTRERDGAVEESCPLLDGNINDEEYRVERLDGTTVPVIKTVISVMRSNQLLIFEIIFDITDRKSMERQLALAHRLESIGGLAAGIAHEINTPIQYIGDNLSFLETAWAELASALTQRTDRTMSTGNDSDLEFLMEEAPKALTQSREGVARVAEIVSAMKRFSHVGGGEKSLLDVPKAIQNTIMISRNEWKYHSEIQLDLDPSVQFLSCFPGDFNQALLNILVNASHANTDKYHDRKDKGTITVKTRCDGSWFVLSLTDTGCGIPAQNLHRIFDPFFTTKEVGKGTGQGLALCHDIVVKKHGGSLDVRSEVGQGTTFFLRFPLQKEGNETRQ